MFGYIHLKFDLMSIFFITKRNIYIKLSVLQHIFKSSPMSMYRVLHHSLNNPILRKVFWFFCYLIVLWSMIVIIIVDAPDFKVGRRMIICPIIEIISSIVCVLGKPVFSLAIIESSIYMLEYLGWCSFTKHTKGVLFAGAMAFISGHISGESWNHRIVPFILNCICSTMFASFAGGVDSHIEEVKKENYDLMLERIRIIESCRRMQERQNEFYQMRDRSMIWDPVKGEYILSNRIQKEAAHDIQEIMFEIKEKIPNGEYLKMMNCVKKLHNGY